MNVKSLCLGILAFGDATGYEINKLASEGRFSHFIEASYGSIYPALTRLTAEGFVTWREESEPGKPARKVYSITPAGHAALVSSLAEPPRPDVYKSEFLFHCLFADFVDEASTRHMIDARAAQIGEEVERLRQAYEKCEHPGSRFAIGYGIAINEAALGYLRAHGTIERSTCEGRPAASVAAE